MMQLKVWGILFFLIAGVSTTMAQDKIAGNMENLLKETLAELDKIDISKSAAVKKVATPPSVDEIFAFDKGLALLNAEAERRKLDIENKKKEFVPVTNNRNPQQIDKDLLALLAKMPEPVISLPTAKKVMKVKSEQNIFTVYIEGLKQYQKQLEETIRRTALDAQADPETVKKEAMDNAKKTMQNFNNNPMIQEAGGMEKLQKMSPEERAALGKRIAEKMKQNPSAYNGQESDPRKAFAKKMMTDAGYAARYNHMDPQQQKEEYEVFMEENGFLKNVPERSGNNQAVVSIAITKRTTAILNHRKELTDIISAAQKRTDDYFTSVNKKLDAQYAARVAALPVVEQGEVGHGRITRPVDIAYNIVLYPIGVQSAVSNKEVWKCQVEALKVTIAEYNEFLSEYWGRDKATDKLMAQRSQTPPAILAGMCNELINLAKLAKALTNQNASWQRTYDEKVLSLYEAQSE